MEALLLAVFLAIAFAPLFSAPHPAASYPSVNISMALGPNESLLYSFKSHSGEEPALKKLEVSTRSNQGKLKKIMTNSTRLVVLPLEDHEIESKKWNAIKRESSGSSEYEQENKKTHTMAIQRKHHERDERSKDTFKTKLLHDQNGWNFDIYNPNSFKNPLSGDTNNKQTSISLSYSGHNRVKRGTENNQTGVSNATSEATANTLMSRTIVTDMTAGGNSTLGEAGTTESVNNTSEDTSASATPENGNTTSPDTSAITSNTTSSGNNTSEDTNAVTNNNTEIGNNTSGDNSAITSNTTESVNDPSEVTNVTTSESDENLPLVLEARNSIPELGGDTNVSTEGIESVTNSSTASSVGKEGVTEESSTMSIDYSSTTFTAVTESVTLNGTGIPEVSAGVTAVEENIEKPTKLGETEKSKP